MQNGNYALNKDFIISKLSFLSGISYCLYDLPLMEFGYYAMSHYSCLFISRLGGRLHGAALIPIQHMSDQ